MTDKEIEAHLNRVVADTASDMADTMSYAMARAIKKTFCKHDWHFLPGTDRLRCIRCNVETGPSTPEQLTQDMLRDVVTMGSAWSQNGKRIDPAEVYAVPAGLAQEFKFHEPQPNSIKFYNGAPDNTEVLRISKDGIWANPDVPADDAAQAVLRAIDGHIKQMVERVQNKEREACALITEQAGADGYGTLAAAAMIRRRSNS
jgi:hypothetical protein